MAQSKSLFQNFGEASTPLTVEQSVEQQQQTQNNQTTQQTTTQTQSDVIQQQQTQAQQTQSITTEQTTTTQQQSTEEFTIKSPFGNVKIDNKEEKIENEKQFFDKLSKQTGQQIDAFDKVFELINDPNKVNKQQLDDVVQEKLEYEQFLRTLPTEVSAILSDVYNKRDYKETMQKIVGAVDYSKPVTAYTDEQMILMFNPDMTTDEIEDLDTKIKTKLINTSKEAYVKEHNGLVTKAKEVETIKFEGAKKFMQSINESIEHLKKEVPEITKEQLNKVYKDMTEGYSLFDDNKYRKEAAYKIYIAENGKDLFQSIITQAENMYQKKWEQDKSNLLEQQLKEKNNDTLIKTSTVVPMGNAQEEIRSKEAPFLAAPKPIKK